MTIKDVHTSHCCRKHGCKYGDDDCTVTTGKAPQEHPCYICHEVDEMLAESGIKKYFNVGIKNKDGIVLTVGITHAGWADRETAERRATIYNKERGHVVSGEGPYVVIARYVSEWEEAV